MTDLKHVFTIARYNLFLILNIIILYWVKIMTECKECKFYKPINESKGDCFGHEVPANMNTDNCPQKAFQPR
jgi:hypothetical protein